MKTKLFLLTGLTVILLNCKNLNAQINYGLHAGFTVGTQSETGLLWDNQIVNPGFLAGVFLEYPIGNIISFQTELNYQKEGNKYSTTLLGIKTITRRDFNYFQIPLLIKGTYHNELDPGDKWNITGFTGPYIGHLISAKSHIKTGETMTSIDISNEIEKSDWGLIFGGGVSLKLNNGEAISAELRYETGFGKIDKEDSDLRNKVIGLNIGYNF
jgi:hypothetical protein